LKRIVLLVVLGLSAAGCGGGGSDAPAALSKADYVKQADAICTTATTTLQGLTAPKNAAELGPYLTRSVGTAKTATDALDRLPAPAADAADLKAKFTGPLAGQVAAVQKLIPQYEAAAKAPDPKTALAAVPRPDIPRPDTAYVTSYGMPGCAKLTQGQAQR